jgi:hypothetical protein
MIRVLDLRAAGEPAAERTVAYRALLADPRAHFPNVGGGEQDA